MALLRTWDAPSLPSFLAKLFRRVFLGLEKQVLRMMKNFSAETLASRNFLSDILLILIMLQFDRGVKIKSPPAMSCIGAGI